MPISLEFGVCWNMYISQLERSSGHMDGCVDLAFYDSR